MLGRTVSRKATENVTPAAEPLKTPQATKLGFGISAPSVQFAEAAPTPEKDSQRLPQMYAPEKVGLP
jgi:hypothetical protein